MSQGGTPQSWDDAILVARLFALQPSGLVLRIRAGVGVTRDAFLAALRALLPETAPILRCPAHPTSEALLGGLDLSATLAAGRPVQRQGLIARAAGGVLLMASAERLPGETASLLCASLDRENAPGLVALDEGEPDEDLPGVLLDRVALRVELDALRPGPLQAPGERALLSEARRRLQGLVTPVPVADALCSAALALGVFPMRATMLAAGIARLAAALAGHAQVEADDAALAAALVLAPRATTIPMPPEAPAQDPPQAAEPQPAEPPDATSPAASDAPPDSGPQEAETQPPDPPDSGSRDDSEDRKAAPDDMRETVLAAAAAMLPPHLLDAPPLAARGSASGAQGRAGAGAVLGTRGRPLTPRPGRPGQGNRLALVETLRHAAPWQKPRRAAASRRTGMSEAEAPRRLLVQLSDLHVSRCSRRPRSTAIFLVDASGSAAMHRLAEAKGAIELLLGECYVRRDRVALLAFRGSGAELLLPPTGALARARRSLAALPGGGGTPVASGLDAALALASQLRRLGETALIVMLTDGRANIARDGTPGRARAEQDARASATRLRAAGLPALLVDIAPRVQPHAEALAASMGARYLRLMQGEPERLSRAVRALAA
ncbi:VWA domain-containing protein [Lichenicoccus sp.]|uniref:VWA domain-containing protein n=1 Tax=Lichenicoccus sp. TaxID=2781899 RepID=UPI003D10CF26